ncbi:MAG: serine hydrolase domain-containing protein, partial [Planctomycetota bacterium]
TRSLRWDLTLGEAFAKDVERIHADLRGVTLEQLLSHRAGLAANPPPSVLRKMLASGESRVARELLLSDGILEKAPDHKPGTKFLYSNLGFMLAGLMAERATDKDWEVLMREELFEPLGMKSAGFGPPGSAKEIDQPRGHGFFGNQLPPGPMTDNPRGLGPAGTVHCSLEDWSKFVALHLQAARGESRLLKRESFEKLHTPLGNDKDEYALGWVVAKRPWADGRVLMHNGSNTYWYVVTWIAPKKNFAGLAACNTGPTAGAQATDAAIVLMLQQAGMLPPAPVTPPSKPAEKESREK